MGESLFHIYFFSSAISCKWFYFKFLFLCEYCKYVHQNNSLKHLFIYCLKKCEKLKQILIMPASVIKICSNWKGLLWHHTKLKRFIYVKNIAVTKWICYKILVTIVIVIKCAMNLQCDRSISNIRCISNQCIKFNAWSIIIVWCSIHSNKMLEFVN